MNSPPRGLSIDRALFTISVGVTMEYVIGVLFGMALLVSLLLFRRRSCLSARRPHLSVRPHRAADAAFMYFAMAPGRSPLTGHCPDQSCLRSSSDGE